MFDHSGRFEFEASKISLFIFILYKFEENFKISRINCRNFYVSSGLIIENIFVQSSKLLIN